MPPNNSPLERIGRLTIFLASGIMAGSSVQHSSTSGPGEEHRGRKDLSSELRETAASIVERVITELTGHIYSPRIKLLDIDQVCEATGLGKSTIYQLIKERKFPKPQANLGKNKWRESGLIAWADANDPNQG